MEDAEAAPYRKTAPIEGRCPGEAEARLVALGKVTVVVTHPVIHLRRLPHILVAIAQVQSDIGANFPIVLKVEVDLRHAILRKEITVAFLVTRNVTSQKILPAVVKRCLPANTGHRKVI